jgi:condensation enzyme
MTSAMEREALERLPVSFSQKMLCQMDSGDDSGPFGPDYHLEVALRLRGPVDPGTMREALSDVVARHETLRTRIIREPQGAYQLVYPPSPARLDVRPCPGVPPAERAERADAFLDEAGATSMSSTVLPLLRGALMQFDDQDSVLVLMTHHVATDGWSMGLLTRDLAACYAARRSGTVPDLPPTRPYRDFVALEQEQEASGKMARSVTYWADTLSGAQLTALRSDFPISANLPTAAAVRRFVIGAELVSDVSRAARAGRCTPFMVLLAAYYQLINRVTGVTDLTVPTITLGRGNGQFKDTVGSFFAFLPLRVNLSECRDGKDLLSRTRATCAGAFSHEIPAMSLLGAAPALMAPSTDDWLANSTFQSVPSIDVLDTTRVGDLEYTEVQRRTDDAGPTSRLPDGMLWTLSFDANGEVYGNVGYRTDRFRDETISTLIVGYQESLRDLVENCLSAS